MFGLTHSLCDKAIHEQLYIVVTLINGFSKNALSSIYLTLLGTVTDFSLLSLNTFDSIEVMPLPKVIFSRWLS
jgi:hypothetical protein